MTLVRSSLTTSPPALLWFLMVSAISYHTVVVVSWSPSSAFRLRKTNHPGKIITFPSNKDESEIHEHFMTLALQEATKAGRVGEVPIGAILVQQQQSKDPRRRRLKLPFTNSNNCANKSDSTIAFRILARAGNRVERHYDASAHAELQVLRKGAKRIKNWRLLGNNTTTTLYSTLEPCPMCLAACQAFRLSNLVYGAPDLRLGAVETHIRLLDIKHPYHNVSNVVKDVCRNESAGLLRTFFQQRRLESKRIKSWRSRLFGWDKKEFF